MLEVGMAEVGAGDILADDLGGSRVYLSTKVR
jgi:hypothetical protein